jgi:hypothetical protein
MWLCPSLVQVPPQQISMLGLLRQGSNRYLTAVASLVGQYPGVIDTIAAMELTRPGALTAAIASIISAVQVG